MWDVSPRFLEALTGPHDPVTIADVYFGGVLQHAGLLLEGGRVEVDESSKVRRTLTLPIADTGLSKRDALDLLSPFGTQIHVRAGIRFGQGDVELAPLGVFIVEDGSFTSHYSSLTCTAADQSTLVADDRFLAPRNTSSALTVVATITALLQETIPALEVYDLTQSPAAAPNATWDRDRWAAVESLAAGIGAEVFFDQLGRAIIRPVPEVTASTTPVWTIADGDQGVLADYATGLSRDKVYNAVVVTGDNTGGAPPVTVAVYQSKGLLRWGGPFGKVPRFFASPVITTVEGARAAGEKVLARSAMYARQVTAHVVPNPALDVGDPIGVTLPDDDMEVRIARALTIPLGLEDTMQIQTRISVDSDSTTDLGTLS